MLHGHLGVPGDPHKMLIFFYFYYPISSFHLLVHPLGLGLRLPQLRQLLLMVGASFYMTSCLPGLFVQFMLLLTLSLRRKIATGLTPADVARVRDKFGRIA